MVGKKSIDGPIQDYDSDSYDEVVEVKAEETPTSSNIDLEQAEPRDLLLYFAKRFKETQSFEYSIEWVKEIAILKSFKERYNLDAGPMIALLFDKYNGVLNGQVMTITAFSKGSKWIQDKLYIELNQDKIKEQEPPINVEGLMDSNDFLGRFTN